MSFETLKSKLDQISSMKFGGNSYLLERILIESNHRKTTLRYKYKITKIDGNGMKKVIEFKVLKQVNEFIKKIE